MNEQEIKNLLSVYQQKVSELTTQTVALEARLMNSNQLVEALNKKIVELQEQQETPKTHNELEATSMKQEVKKY
jgi:CII-binding regulator of phage lambda lysogenization HflD